MYGFWRLGLRPSPSSGAACVANGLATATSMKRRNDPTTAEHGDDPGDQLRPELRLRARRRAVRRSARAARAAATPPGRPRTPRSCSASAARGSCARRRRRTRSRAERAPRGGRPTRPRRRRTGDRARSGPRVASRRRRVVGARRRRRRPRRGQPEADDERRAAELRHRCPALFCGVLGRALRHEGTGSPTKTPSAGGPRVDVAAGLEQVGHRAAIDDSTVAVPFTSRRRKRALDAAARRGATTVPTRATFRAVLELARDRAGVHRPRRTCRAGRSPGAVAIEPRTRGVELPRHGQCRRVRGV